MTEELLKFLWVHKLYTPESLRLSDGRYIEVIHPGTLNQDAGPDFFNTRIKIGQTIWAGNAEVHNRASDWNRHRHSGNGAFDNVVLHIVAENDCIIHDSHNQPIPAITLQCNDNILHHYDYLRKNQLWVPCAREITGVDRFVITLWLEKMGAARLQQKSEEVNIHLDQTRNNWEEVLYRFICRSFGFHLNSQPMEQLAKSLPFKILEQHSNSLMQTEAMLFGQAGFLHELIPYDDYFQRLQKEYSFLAGKYHLKAVPKYHWKFLRLRPGNFPTIRLAQLAAILHSCSKLFAFIKEEASLDTLCKQLMVTPSSYWENHYLFGKVSHPKDKTMGRDSAEILLMNAFAPVLFTYGRKTGLEEFQNKALSILEHLPPEKNTVVDHWKKSGILAESAFQSQALLFMKSSYCELRRCLDCQIGSKIILQDGS